MPSNRPKSGRRDKRRPAGKATVAPALCGTQPATKMLNVAHAQQQGPPTPAPERPLGAPVEPTAGGTRNAERGRARRARRPPAKPAADAGQAGAPERKGSVNRAAPLGEDTAFPGQRDSSALGGRDRGRLVQRTISAGSSGSDEVEECSGEQSQEPPAVRRTGTAQTPAEIAQQGLAGMEAPMVGMGLTMEEVPAAMRHDMAELQKSCAELLDKITKAVAEQKGRLDNLKKEVRGQEDTIAAHGGRISKLEVCMLPGRHPVGLLLPLFDCTILLAASIIR
jgi:hypothetical protein